MDSSIFQSPPKSPNVLSTPRCKSSIQKSCPFACAFQLLVVLLDFPTLAILCVEVLTVCSELTNLHRSTIQPN